MSNRTWDAEDASVWRDSSFSALWTLYSLSWYFHARQRRSPGIQISSAVFFSPSSHEQHPSFPTCDLTLIYNLSRSFCILGFWRGISVQLSQNIMHMHVYLHCSEWFTSVCAVFIICKPPLSTRLGLTQLFTIKQWEMLSTEYEALGLSLVARKLRIDWPSGG